MEHKILYRDDIISVRETNKDDMKYIYTHEEISDGNRIVILPFRKKLIGYEFLLRRELIPCWDSHSDICSISSKLINCNPEQTAIDEVKDEAGYEVNLLDLIPLGVVSASKSSDTTYYLYSVDLSAIDSEYAFDEPKEDISFWGIESDIMKSIDAQLIACYGKLKYLIL